MRALTGFPLEEIAYLVLGATIFTEDAHVQQQLELTERDVVCVPEGGELAVSHSRHAAFETPNVCGFSFDWIPVVGSVGHSSNAGEIGMDSLARDEVGFDLVDINARSFQAATGLGARAQADVVVSEQSVGVFNFSKADPYQRYA